MESLRIEKSEKTPLFIMKDGYIRLSGRSITQNSRQLFKPCLDWVKQYVQTPAIITQIDLFFEYIDTSSIRCLVDILVVLGTITKNNSDNQIKINWYYERDDDDAYDLGAYIKAHLKVPFNIIPIDEGTDIPE